MFSKTKNQKNFKKVLKSNQKSMKKMSLKKIAFHHQILLIFVGFGAHFEAQKGPKAVPEGGRFLRGKMVAKKVTKKSKNFGPVAPSYIRECSTEHISSQDVRWGVGGKQPKGKLGRLLVI